MELVKTKENHNQEIEVITKGTKKLMKKIEKLEAKILKLENMKRMLFMQTQHQLEQLQEYEAMDVRRPNIILETLVCVSTEETFAIVSPCFTREYVSCFPITNMFLIYFIYSRANRSVPKIVDQFIS